MPPETQRLSPILPASESDPTALQLQLQLLTVPCGCTGLWTRTVTRSRTAATASCRHRSLRQATSGCFPTLRTKYGPPNTTPPTPCLPANSEPVQNLRGPTDWPLACPPATAAQSESDHRAAAGTRHGNGAAAATSMAAAVRGGRAVFRSRPTIALHSI